MLLKVVDNGEHKDIHINEGIHPSGINNLTSFNR